MLPGRRPQLTANPYAYCPKQQEQTVEQSLGQRKANVARTVGMIEHGQFVTLVHNKRQVELRRKGQKAVTLRIVVYIHTENCPRAARAVHPLLVHPLHDTRRA